MKITSIDFRRILSFILMTLFFQYASAVVRYVKPVVSGTGTGLSWANAAADLQLMINNSSSGDEIWVVQGTYYPLRKANATGTVTLNNRDNAFVLKNGVGIYGGFIGTEIFRSSRNYTTHITTLSGDIGTIINKTDNCFHVVVAAGALSGNGIMDGFTITNGYADGISGITVNAETLNANRGGAVYVVAASPSLVNCIVRRSEALNGFGGGGMYATGTANPVFNKCTFSTNSTTGSSSHGGGVYMATTTATFSNCTFTGNTSAGQGGGLYVSTSGAPAMVDCNFTNNTSASSGGGIYSTSFSSVSMLNCKFTGNAAGGITGGGGIFNEGSSLLMSGCLLDGNSAPNGGAIYSVSYSPVITECIITNNTAGNHSGGIELTSSSPTIRNCIISGNNALLGGGIYITNFSAPKITNCVITGNTATTGGGGIHVQMNSSTPTFTNCTIAYNQASAGAGGIYVLSPSSLSLQNSICWGNVAPSSSNIFPSSGLAVTTSLVQGGYVGGTFIINADPLFISPPPLAALTTAGDFRLQKCSPAINAGNNAAIPAGVTTDLDGNARIFNLIVDMGCFEYNSFNTTNIPDMNGIIYVDATKSGNGSTWGNAVTELSDALLAAKYNPGILEIWVAKGTYKPTYNASDNSNSYCASVSRDNAFVLVNNVKVYGGFFGGETSVAQRNISVNTTTLSGDIGTAGDNTDNCYHVVISAGAVGTAALDGFTISGGTGLTTSSINVNSISTDRYRGGGIFTVTSSPLINNCTFISNMSSSGGGLATYNNASPSIINCSFISNTAYNSGGGIDNYTGSNSLIKNCNFLNNISQSHGGGIVVCLTTPAIDGCIFSGNSAPDGGGVYLISNSGIPKLYNCVITGNSSTQSGGGVYMNASKADIVNCTIGANKASTGSVIMNVFGSTTTIKNSIIWGNLAVSGNIIYNEAGSALSISNSDLQEAFAGTGNITTDPLFVNAQSASVAPVTGGDYSLKRCSPALDLGNNSFISGYTADIVGNLRIVNGNVDMGAYEKQYAIGDATGTVFVDVTKNGDGKTWATAVPELADALKAAKYNSAITQVWVAKGTYYPLYDAATLGCFPSDNRDKSLVLVNNVKLYGGFAGGETSIAGRNFITNETILSADIGIANDNTDNCYHVAVSAGAVGTVLMDGFTITKGNANGSGDITVNGNISDRVRGAGISNLFSSPGIANCTFSFNNAGAGAAVANYTAAPTFNNCTFLSNTATGSGGVMDNYFNSAASVNNCILTGNAANSGGAIMNSGGSLITISNAVFSGNTAIDGGAFYNHASTNATITNCLFNGNKAANGAGMYFRSSSPQLKNCTVTANLASVAGGGIFNNNAAPVIRNSIVWANNAITNNNISILSGTPIIQNSIIEGGYAGGTNIINADPLFVAPQPASASPTTLGNYHLQTCSPAMNYGDNSFVTAATDLDNNPRIKFTDVDLGAYEVQTQDLTQSTWRGINTNWNDRVNWCGGYIPLATTNVTIPSGLTNYPTTALTNAVKNLSLANNTSVTVSNTGSLSINGTYSNTGSTIANNGNWMMTGSSSSQAFPGTSATITAMNNLEINNPSGITLNKSFSITGALIPTAGNINVNNVDITLKSSDTATASVAIIQPAASITQTGAGSFIVERFINTGTNTAIGQHAKSWQFLATPVSGQTIFQSWQESGTVPPGFGTWVTGTGTGFDVATVLPSIKFYNDNANGWTAETNTGNALQNRNGYMLYVRGDRTVTTSAGAPNNTNMRSKGTIFTTTNPPPSVLVQANKFQAIGNPYPSRIAFNRLLNASTGVNDVFYVWDPKIPGNYQSGSYQTLTGITGYAPTVGAANTNYPAGMPSPNIESGQAFFVRGNGTGGNINFNEAIKATGNRLVSRNDSNAILERQFLYASLFYNDMIADGNIIAFEAGFGNEVNNLDAYKIMNSGENFGLQRNDAILAVEAHDAININDTIFYHLQNLRQQNYQLRFAPVNLSDMILPAFLIDRYAGSINTINLHDSSFVDFTVTADTASYATDRFIIVFKLSGPVPITFTKVKAYRNEKNINVTWQVENETSIQFYEVEKSLTGNNFFNIATVAARNNHQAAENYLSVDTDPSSAVNFYRIKSTGAANQINYSNIVKVLPIQAKSNISVYPNPVVDGNIQLWFSNIPEGHYEIKLLNAAGQIFYKKEIQHAETDRKIIIKPKQEIARGHYTIEIDGKENNRFVQSLIY